MPDPDFPFLWERDVLVEQYGGRRYLYGRWDRRFGCWIADDDEPLRPCYPSWKLVDARGRLCLGYSGAPDLWLDADDRPGECSDFRVTYSDPFEFSTGCFGDYPVYDTTMAELNDTAEDLFQRYVALIPFAIRQAAGAFGTL
jgi:hypothetical protein